jgi:hypothetical protein
MWSVCGHCVSLISLGYLDFCWAWDFIDNLCSIPLDRATYLYSILNIKYISSTWACTRWMLPLHLFFDFMRVATLDLVLALTLRRLWLGILQTIWSISTFDLQITLYLDSIKIDTSRYVILHGYLDTSDSNIHLPFTISGTSTPRLVLALHWCMVHHVQVHVNPSLTTIMSHT